MSIEELLKPRIKILADWPGVSGVVIPNSIIPVDDEFDEPMFWIGGEPFLIDKIRDYPYLFKELEWCEEREISDLPEYVRFGELDKKHAFYKVKYFNGKEANLYSHYMPCGFAEGMKDYLISLKFPNCFPATKEEYDQYKNENEKPEL